MPLSCAPIAGSDVSVFDMCGLHVCVYVLLSCAPIAGSDVSVFDMCGLHVCVYVLLSCAPIAGSDVRVFQDERQLLQVNCTITIPLIMGVV